jgi:ligand-binding sensor domain-containing protein
MKKYLIPLSIAILTLSQCKKEDTDDNVIVGVPVTRVAAATYLIATDNRDNLWFGTDSGLYKFDNMEWTKYELPLTAIKVTSVDIENDSMLVSSPSGAVKVRLAANGISVMDEYNTSTAAIISDIVNIANFDPFNNLWLGTNNGLSFYNGSKWASNSKINFKLTASGSNVSCSAFRQNESFFGTLGKYLWHVTYNTETDAVTGASQLIDGFNGRLCTDTILSLCTGSDLSIWIGSNTGLTRNKGETHFDFGEFEFFLEGEKVHSILESADHRIWAGTENGLFVKENDNWTSYTTSNNLPDNLILSLAEDKDGGIWIGTPKGVTCFRNGSFTNY